MPEPRYHAEEEDGIWTVCEGMMPIGRALTEKDARDFVEAFNGILGNALRDRLLTAVNDAVEGAFDG